MKMTKLVYRGIEFDNATARANAKTTTGAAGMIYRGFNNKGQAVNVGTPGATGKNTELTYRGFRVK